MPQADPTIQAERRLNDLFARLLTRIADHERADHHAHSEIASELAGLRADVSGLVATDAGMERTLSSGSLVSSSDLLQWTERVVQAEGRAEAAEKAAEAAQAAAEPARRVLTILGLGYGAMGVLVLLDKLNLL